MLNQMKTMRIRQAVAEDAAFIAPQLLLAMRDNLYKKIGEEDEDKAEDLLHHFVKRENNQYSYQNCLVAEDGGEIVGAVNIYDGAKLHELREPIKLYIKTHYNADFAPEDETQAGEYYIDSVGVNPKCQGTGVGTKMLEFVVDEYVKKRKEILGLLVDEDNAAAKALYAKVGFKPVGEISLRGIKMKRLQVRP